MPIKIPDKLPATKILNGENIFVMTDKRALKQDIRPLKLVILNIMPTKIVTETQLMRLLGNTPLQVEIDLLHMKTHTSKNTPAEHLQTFYKDFDDIRNNKYDGMIITGAPVEKMEFEDVTYWDELKEIMEWTQQNVTSVLHICWAAQAGLHYHYGVPKFPLDKKMFGIFEHKVIRKKSKLLRGFDDVFFAPHSRHTEIRRSDVEKIPELQILSESDVAGLYIVASKDRKNIFVTGHSEYDADTLHKEYMRDVEAGKEIEVPVNYYPNDDCTKPPKVIWRSHANLLFSNWLNYYVYQSTPYDINKVK